MRPYDGRLFLPGESCIGFPVFCSHHALVFVATWAVAKVACAIAIDAYHVVHIHLLYLSKHGGLTVESDTICTVVLKAAIDPEGIAVLATASKVKDVVTMTDTDGGDEGGVHCLSSRSIHLFNHGGLTDASQTDIYLVTV